MQQNAKIITMKTSSNFSTNIYIDTYIYKWLCNDYFIRSRAAGDLMSDSSGILSCPSLLYLSFLFFSMKNTFVCRIPRSIFP